MLYPNAVNVATAIRDLFGNRVVLSYGTADDRLLRDLQERFSRFDILNSRALGLGIFQGGGIGGGGLGGGIGGGIGGFGGGIGGGGIGGFGGGIGGGGIGGYGGGIGGYGGGIGGYGGGIGGYGGGIGGYGGGTGALPAFPFQTQTKTQTQPTQRLPELTPDEIQELEKAFTEGKVPDRTILLELLQRRPANIYVTVVREHNQLIVRTSDQKILDQIRDLVCRLDVPTPVILLEVNVLQINLMDSFNSIFDYQFTNAVLSAGSFTTGNILPPFADKDPPNVRRYETIAPGPLGTDPSQNFTFQVVSANFRAHAALGIREPGHAAGHAAHHDGQQRSQPHFQRRRHADHDRFHAGGSRS